MPGTRRAYWVASLTLILGLGLAGCVGGGSNQDRIMIRIHNGSPFDFSNCWLGAGPKGGATRNTTFGSIRSGESTRYKHIDPVLANYHKIDIVVDNQRFLDTIDFVEHIGSSELEPGWYTFAYNIVENEAVLTLTQDTAP